MAQPPYRFVVDVDDVRRALAAAESVLESIKHPDPEGARLLAVAAERTAEARRLVDVAADI